MKDSLLVSTRVLRERARTSRADLEAKRATTNATADAMGGFFAQESANNGGDGLPPLLRIHGGDIQNALRNGNTDYLKWAKTKALHNCALYSRAAENDWGRIFVTRDHRSRWFYGC
jgi:hypothetical protein